jgi:NAD(P)-dependent dehydrogenase (short-subunit alcohol dehydrogenase family)
LSGKRVLVTGGTSGIGQAAVAQLARAGAHVIAQGRDAEKGARVVAELAKDGDVELATADLSSLASVRELAAKIGAVDVLILNAAMSAWGTERAETSDGFERVFGTNYLAHFLLARLLVEQMPRGGRIVAVGAQQMGSSHFDWDDLQLARGWTPLRATTQAKLAMFCMTRAFAQRFAARGITANIVDPGLVMTPYQTHASWLLRLAVRMAGKPPEKVAETYAWLALDPALADVTGKAFRYKKEIRIKGAALDDAIVDRLYTVSEQLVKLVPAAA